MDSLIRTCIWAVLITGILGRTLFNQTGTLNSTEAEISEDTSSSPGIFVTLNEVTSENTGISEDTYPTTGISVPSTEATSVIGSQCYFDGKAYDIGVNIPGNNSCIKCNCQVPPDVTCTLQSCPSPPSTENCNSSYYDNQCCPTYECVLGEENTDNISTDESNKGICPTPLCADRSCVIGILPGHQCPTCICDDSREKNDLEPSHEKNDLEPFFHEIEPQDMTSDNKTLDNEILSPLTPKNFSEREPLSQVFGEDPLQKNKSKEGETTEGLESAPELELLLPKTEDSTYRERTSGSFDDSVSASRESRQKRSEQLQTAAIQSSNSEQWNVLQQDQSFEDPGDLSENSEREMEGTDENVAEVKILNTRDSKSSQKSFDELVELDDNELENVIWTSEVPGCPAPMCANSSCRIGIPPGQSCPTCVCRKRRRQP